MCHPVPTYVNWTTRWKLLVNSRAFTGKIMKFLNEIRWENGAMSCCFCLCWCILCLLSVCLVLNPLMLLGGGGGGGRSLYTFQLIEAIWRRNSTPLRFVFGLMVCYHITNYRQVSIRHTLVSNRIVVHWDVVATSPVGATPTTYSFLT